MVLGQRRSFATVGTAKAVGFHYPLPVFCSDMARTSFPTSPIILCCCAYLGTVFLAPCLKVLQYLLSVLAVVGLGPGQSQLTVLSVVFSVPSFGLFSMCCAVIGVARSDVCRVFRSVHFFAFAAARVQANSTLTALSKSRGVLRFATLWASLVEWKRSVVGPLCTQRFHGASSIP